MRSTIELGHAMGLRIVAEGIEDRDTLDLLAGLGCDVAQGYFISRPKPATELVFRPRFKPGAPTSTLGRGGDPGETPATPVWNGAASPASPDLFARPAASPAASPPASRAVGPRRYCFGAALDPAPCLVPPRSARLRAGGRALRAGPNPTRRSATS